jgi:hypothetical protein
MVVHRDFTSLLSSMVVTEIIYKVLSNMMVHIDQLTLLLSNMVVHRDQLTQSTEQHGGAHRPAHQVLSNMVVHEIDYQSTEQHGCAHRLLTVY